MKFVRAYAKVSKFIQVQVEIVTEYTFQPSVLKRNRFHSFRAHMVTKNGRQVLARYHTKGRARLIVLKQ